jgi:hypothetical protein
MMPIGKPALKPITNHRSRATSAALAGVIDNLMELLCKIGALGNLSG